MIVRSGLSRYRGMRGRAWRGMGYVSPVGFADFGTFQSAVIASFPTCPPPFDPTCENPLNAQIAANLNEWVTNPQSCHNIVCGSSGAPAIGPQPAGGIGYNTTSGFVPVAPIPASAAAPLPALTSLASPVFHPSASSTPVLRRTPSTPPSYPATIPTQSNSADTAPGGASSTSSTIPIQTQTPPDATTPTTSDFGTFLSSIPIWGWGIGALALVLITRGGKR